MTIENDMWCCKAKYKDKEHVHVVTLGGQFFGSTKPLLETLVEGMKDKHPDADFWIEKYEIVMSGG